ncbi:rhomboid family intramembrane serine protease GlpG [Enterobacteriaceae bacterium LUAb1]
MRITEFTHPRQAQAFVDYMATQGVILRLQKAPHAVVLWLDDPSQQKKVATALDDFLRDPLHPRYLAASWQSGTTQSGLHYERSASLMTRLQARAGGLTLSVMMACVLVFAWQQIAGDREVMLWLAWPADPSQYMQLWRWVSHALLHFSLLHILFNLLWWWYLGGRVEKRLGTGKLAVITLISALLSGWVQAKFSGIWFGGLSGVVYALIGYCWLRGEREPDSGIFPERGLMAFAIVWLVIGYFDMPGLPVANGAHVAGLLTGLAMAFVDSYARANRRKL